jgi:hypothetical protein
VRLLHGSFTAAAEKVKALQYDVLDVENSQFEADVGVFQETVVGLDRCLAAVIVQVIVGHPNLYLQAMNGCNAVIVQVIVGHPNLYLQAMNGCNAVIVQVIEGHPNLYLQAMNECNAVIVRVIVGHPNL